MMGVITLVPKDLDTLAILCRHILGKTLPMAFVVLIGYACAAEVVAFEVFSRKGILNEQLALFNANHQVDECVPESFSNLCDHRVQRSSTCLR